MLLSIGFYDELHYQVYSNLTYPNHNQLLIEHFQTEDHRQRLTSRQNEISYFRAN